MDGNHDFDEDIINRIKNQFHHILTFHEYEADANILFCFSVDGGYSQFGDWSACSVTCGRGNQTRMRTCTEPPPSQGGADCVGEASETRPCYNMSGVYRTSSI